MPTGDAQSFGFREFVLFGEGWRYKRDALVAGRQYRDAMVVALLAKNLPALVDEPEQHVLPYLSHPPLSAQDVGAASMQSAPEQLNTHALLAEMERLTSLGCALTEREARAVRLLYISTCQAVLEVRFILQFMAVETLLERPEHREAVRDLLEKLIIAVRSDQCITASENASLVSSLQALRKESLGGAGRRFVRERLNNRKYGGRRADRFFTECYNIRNRVVHASLTEKDYRILSTLVHALEVFVPDLVAWRYLTPNSSQKLSRPGAGPAA